LHISKLSSKIKKEAVKKAQDEADKILKIKLDAKDKEIEEKTYKPKFSS